MRQNWRNYTLFWHIWCHFSDVTWLKQPRLSLHEVEAKHSRSSTQWKLPWWKQNVKKTQRSGSDKKPSVLETWTAKTNSAESLHGSVSDSRRPPAGVGSPLPYGWKDIWLTKSQFLYNLSFLVSLNYPPCTTREQVSSSGCSWGTLERLLPSVSWKLHYPLPSSSCCPSRWGFFCP